MAANESRRKYLVLTCPSCKVRFRIPEMHAHLRGRCPECRHPIDPPRPRTLISDAPGDLAPITAEWPEQPQVIDKSGVSKKPSSTNQPTTSRSSYAIQRSEVQNIDKRPDSDRSRKEETLVGNRKKKNKRKPAAQEDSQQDEEPVPPRLWANVVEFPIWPSNLRIWLLLSIGFTCMACLAAYIHFLLVEFVDGGWTKQQLMFRIIPYPIAGLVMLSLFTLSYFSSHFEAIIQDTAAGNEQVKWPDDGFMERLIRLGYVGWLVFFSSLPMGILFFLGRQLFAQQPFAWLVLFPPTLMLFPIILLSSMLNASPWMIWNGSLLVDLMNRPLALLALVASSFGLFYPCILLGYFAVLHENYAVAPMFGLAVPACMMIFARVIGRVAWLVTEGKDLKRWRRRVLLERERNNG